MTESTYVLYNSSCYPTSFKAWLGICNPDFAGIPVRAVRPTATGILGVWNTGASLRQCGGGQQDPAAAPLPSLQLVGIHSATMDLLSNAIVCT